MLDQEQFSGVSALLFVAFAAPPLVQLFFLAVIQQDEGY